MICKHLCTWVGFILLLSRCARSIDNDLGILKESCKQGHWIQIESMHPEHASNKHRKHSKQILPPPKKKCRKLTEKATYEGQLLKS